MSQIDEQKLAELGDLYDHDPHVHLAQVAFQLEKFMGSLVGKTLLKRAQTQIDDAVSDMLELDPDDDKAKFRSRRMDALVAQQALTWLKNILDDGEVAVKQLNDQDGYTEN